MRIALLSDTHELHRQLDPIAADLLIHAGDWSFFSKNLSAIEDFDDWLGEQKVRYTPVLVPGNHEFYLEADPTRSSFTRRGMVLNGTATEIEGLRLWGSPVTPLFGGAFGMPDPQQRARHYAQIPAGTHVLVTHGPPYGILDGPPGSSEHHGCQELLKAVQRVQPRIHVFGHVHGGCGTVQIGETTFVNAALLGTDGDIANKPVFLKLTSGDS